jgi:mRNA interferase MazF
VTPFAPWQVWWADLDPVLGKEQAGRRPVVIVSSVFHLALTRYALVTALPLTTRQRPGWEHHVPVEIPGKPASYVLTEQVRTFASRRLAGDRPIATLTADQIAAVRPILAAMLDAPAAS